MEARKGRIVRIPEGYEDRFARLVYLEDSSVQELVSTLQRQSPTLDYHEIGRKIGQDLSTVSAEEAEEVMKDLIPLYLLRARVDWSVPEFVEDVLRAMDDTNFEDLMLSGQKREMFREHMSQLLSVEPIEISIKADDLLLEHEHTLHDAKILTDVRPVFGHDVEEAPKATIVTYTLKISYHDEGEETKELYVALDGGDVNTLIETLERAKAKSRSLKRAMYGSNMSYIETE